MLASASIRRMVKSDAPSIQPERLRGKAVLYTGDDEGQGRAPSLIQRASNAAAEILGESYGTLVYSLLEGCKRGHIGQLPMRLLLERCLPAERPTPVTLPLIDCAADLLEADRRLMAAANVGAISHSEWRKAQECIEASWRIRQQARLEEP
jgi:hypothetical protein